MNGIIVLNKPKGYTSRDVVNEISHILGIKKIGHTGTLDPIATGVLVLCVGGATKVAELITAYQKVYKVEVLLGALTDTLDETGTILQEENVKIKKEEIEKVLSSFKKTYMQKVPIYSAIKVNGKKLYEYAREKKQVDLPFREVTIFSIHLDGDICYKNGKTCFSFTCEVSKGTYIRSLICDIATSLGTIGCMRNLCRVKQGFYDLKDSYTIEEVREGDFSLQSIETALSSYPKFEVSEELEEKIKNGCILENDYGVDYPLFINKNGMLLALYKPYHDHLLKPFKMLKSK